MNIVDKIIELVEVSADFEWKKIVSVRTASFEIATYLHLSTNCEVQFVFNYNEVDGYSLKEVYVGNASSPPLRLVTDQEGATLQTLMNDKFNEAPNESVLAANIDKYLKIKSCA